jgi:hypothetical protein
LQTLSPYHEASTTRSDIQIALIQLVHEAPALAVVVSQKRKLEIVVDLFKLCFLSLVHAIH